MQSFMLCSLDAVLLQAEVSELLSRVLSGKVLRLAADFFTFEYVYKNHTRHYHDEHGIITGAFLAVPQC